MPVLLVVALLFAAALPIAFHLSPVMQARKAAERAFGEFDSLRAGFHAEDEARKRDVSQAAAGLAVAVRAQRLRRMPLDVIKTYAAGVRLQALKDAGLSTILDLQGMNAGRLSEIRGVGEKSAGLIAAVVVMLSKTSNQQPVEAPRFPFTGDREAALILCTYRMLSFDSSVAPLRESLAELQSLAERQIERLRSDSRFVAWVAGLFRAGRQSRFREMADDLMHRLQGTPEALALKSGLLAAVSTSRDLSAGPVAPEIFLAAYRASPLRFDWHLSRALGHADPGQEPMQEHVSENESELSSHELQTPATSKDLTPAASGAIGPASAEINSALPPEKTHSPRTDGPEDELAAEQTSAEAPTHVEFGRLMPGPPPGLVGNSETRSSEPSAPAKNAGQVLHQLRRIQALRLQQDVLASTALKSTETPGIEAEGRHRDEFTTLQVGSPDHASPRDFRIPASSSTEEVIPTPTWAAPGESVTIQGIPITRAYFFFAAKADRLARYVLDASLAVEANTRQWFEENSPSWSYAALSPRTRFHYLHWLADGAEAQEVPLGFPAIYFQGLERRVLQLHKVGPAGLAAESDDLTREIRRLEKLFRDTRNTVSSQSRLLLEFLFAVGADDKSEPSIPSYLVRSFELPFEVRLGVAWFVRAKLPLPAEWALHWTYLEPTIYLRAAVTRFPREFAASFRYLYHQKLGEGLIIRRPKTLLSLTYKPTWTGGSDEPVHLELSGLPDVKASMAPQTILRELAAETGALIDRYSRSIGPAGAQHGTLEALLLLPGSAWPDEAKARFALFLATVVQKQAVLSCTEVWKALECRGEITPLRVTELARRLRRFGIGFEPDVLSGARRPKAADPVVLFAVLEEAEEDRKAASYQAAALCVALAAVLTLADGHASDTEAAALDQIIAQWDGIGADSQSRLRAYYQLCLRQPPTVASLKARLESLALEDRDRVGSSLALIAAADGNVSPEEVKLLERVYKVLTLETETLYSDLHNAAGRLPRGVNSAGLEKSNLRAASALDHARIAELRRESNAVSELLAEVFLGEEANSAANAVSAPVTVAPVEEPAEVSRLALQGLSAVDQRFLALLTTKPEWPRQELLQSAKAMQLMLDGTLERINEAALDHLGDYLIDGDDPIYVQQTLLETVP